jgi:hypothetical protein
MFESLFEGNRGTPLDDVALRLRRLAQSRECALTVNASDFHIPWRMLYTHPDPIEPLSRDGSNFDPKGFWGFQHIIEQFTNNYEVNDYVLATKKLGFAAALHERLDEELHVKMPRPAPRFYPEVWRPPQIS